MPRKGLGASDAEIARYVFDKRRGLMERLAALTAPACAGCAGLRHKRARISASVLADPELAGVVTRQPKRVSQPPDAWDDLIVSHWRGQAWARRDRIRG